MTQNEKTMQKNNQIKQTSPSWIWIVLLIGILMIGAYFRFVGLDWDEDHHLHPDERFLTMVSSAISPVESFSDYFDTANSSLNPNNRGYGFYVYGTLPLFFVRYLAEWLGQTGYSEVYLVGRAVSAVADLLTILLVYLVAVRIYKNHRLGLLAAAFSAFSVLQIQLSHYYTVDIFANLFSFLTFYLAVFILTGNNHEKEFLAAKTNRLSGEEGDEIAEEEEQDWTGYLSTWFKGSWNSVFPYLFFGAALGMAMASKISTAPLAILLPVAAGIRFYKRTPEERNYLAGIYIRNIILAAIVSVIAFRIFQPFAFNGPGFFNMLPSEKWIASLKELSGQSSGDVDFPPALQWARRSLSFGYDNLVNYGLGLPLGILATIGFILMGIRIFKGEAEKHGLLWVWTGVYFVWQSTNFTSSMRYFLPIYPTLVIIAAWTVFQIGRGAPEVGSWLKRNWRRTLSLVIGISVLGLTFAWAFAFSRIYTRPVTRVEASDWIYQNVPAAINLKIDTGEENYNQPLGFKLGTMITDDNPFTMAFTTHYEGIITEVTFAHVINRSTPSEEITLVAEVVQEPGSESTLTDGIVTGQFSATNDQRGDETTFLFANPLYVYPGQTYYLTLNVSENGNVSIYETIDLTYSRVTETRHQYLAEPVMTISLGQPYDIFFTAKENGAAKEVYLPHVVDWLGTSTPKSLQVSLFDSTNAAEPLAQTIITSDFSVVEDKRGEAYSAVFEDAVEINSGLSYFLRFQLVEGYGDLALYGSKQAIESTWDDSLPISLDGYSPFDYYTGLYRSDLNFEMYWDDNASKLERFYSILDQADYIFISSNRQWGTTIRVPERYPLTTAYYRNLLGCPDDEDLFTCYSIAEPGMYESNLGFELVKISQSDPNLGELRFNTQFAEEAFTVYDAPKVLIFKKSSAYDPEKVKEILGSVDLSQVVHLTPRQASDYSGNLLLSIEKFSQQKKAGTWSELFDRDNIVNSNQFLTVLIWYLMVTLLGWAVYPLVRIIFSGLSDRGYPLIKISGLVLLAYFVWLSSSSGISYSNTQISIVFIGLLFINLVIFIVQRDSIFSELKKRWKYYLAIEIIGVLLFSFFLLIRLGNPDLWHPYKGGEKPMDFSYLNAILKSENFPPYDPWFEGGYVNYYYYGLMMVSVPVKWLGIVPSVAYNLILPTLFCMLGLGAFSVGWNLVDSKGFKEKRTLKDLIQANRKQILAGIFVILLFLILGNLGTIRMIWHGFQKLANTIPIEDGNFFQHWTWTIQGIAKYIKGASLPYSPGDWYWIPSRALPNEPITEFPFFTFLYADLHAHLIALPLAVLGIAWGVSFLRQGWKWEVFSKNLSWLQPVLVILFGALVIGSLKPTNTWDLYTYLPLGCVIVLYTGFKNNFVALVNGNNKERTKIVFQVLLAAAALFVFSSLLFSPFSKWYGQGYNSIELWKGDHTPFWSYFTHWGLFLFLILSWMIWETREWMAATPVSALRKLKPALKLIQVGLVVLILLIIGLLIMKISIAWLVIPMIIWAGILILRPGQNDLKRLMLFLVGTALVLTLAVELIVLKGDIGRMNTVFKLYMQAWTLLSISSAVMLVKLIPAVLDEWKNSWRTGWSIVLALLLGSAALFPLLAGVDKVTDRMVSKAPHTLDGMTYMNSGATYSESGVTMDLSQDYAAILWIQENIEGTPVIVEANTPEYRWGSRYTIYTGLPGVVGWNWHQRQQRAVTSSTWVTDRVEDISHFYLTVDPDEAEEFLKKYQVDYIIVGQLERAYYTGAGLNKFDLLNGDLWMEVYREADTVIYKVLD